MPEAEKLTIEFLPLSSLKLPAAKHAVRKTASTAEEDAELEASIDAHGLISSLVVGPPRGKKPYYSIIAGCRRYRVLKKKRPVDFEVPCRVLQPGAGAGEGDEIAIAENTCRVSLHPADQMDAFEGLHSNGMSVTDIAARFGLAESTVLKRLKESTVSPKVKEAYREGRINLETLQAMTIAGKDHQRQDHVLERVCDNGGRGWCTDVRHLLTKDAVRGDRPEVKAVGLEVYKAAGGKVSTDLFYDPDNPDDDSRGLYLENPDLVEELLAAKFEEKTAELEGEGWKWIERIGQGYDPRQHEWRRMAPSKGTDYGPKQKGQGGCFIRAGNVDGGIEVLAGFVRPQDEKVKGTNGGTASAAGDAGADDDRLADTGSMSQTLKKELERERGNVIRKAMMVERGLTIELLLFEVVRAAFANPGDLYPQALEFTARAKREIGDPPDVSFLVSGDGCGGGVDEHFRKWMEMSSSNRDKLASAAIARMFIDRLTTEPGFLNGRGSYIEDFVSNLGIDWPKAWRPTADNYFGRLKLPQLRALAKELDPATTSINYMKKGPLCDLLEQVCRKNDWLPDGFIRRAPEHDDVVDEKPADVEDDAGDGAPKVSPARPHVELDETRCSVVWEGKQCRLPADHDPEKACEFEESFV